MPLTPEDVDNKRFATARVMRQGYDMTEVDNFLDEVAAEMKRLHDEIDELRSQAASSGGAPAQETTVAQASAPDGTTDEAPAAEASDAGTTSSDEPGDQASEGNASEGSASEGSASEGRHAEQAPSETPDEADASSTTATGTHAVADQPEEELAGGDTEVARVSGTRGETLRVTTTEEAAAAAARMLELAGRNAEELVADARTQAETIVSEASGRAQQLDGETEERRNALVAELERDHQELKDEVEDLRVFEREYRAQLRNYFQQQLEALDAQGGGVTLAEDLHEDEGEIGSRLRSILAEEEDASGPPPSAGTDVSADTGQASADSSGTEQSGTQPANEGTPDGDASEGQRPTT